MPRKISDTHKAKIIHKAADNFRKVRAHDRLLATLQQIVDVYDMRSELFTSDAECAANLADRARLALSAREPQ